MSCMTGSSTAMQAAAPRTTLRRRKSAKKPRIASLPLLPPEQSVAKRCATRYWRLLLGAVCVRGDQWAAQRSWHRSCLDGSESGHETHWGTTVSTAKQGRSYWSERRRGRHGDSDERSKAAQEKRGAGNHSCRACTASDIRSRTWLARSRFTRHIWASRSTPTASRVRQRVARRCADSAQRATSVRISADAERAAAGTGRMEPCRASGQRSARVHRGPEEGGPPLSERHGDRAGGKQIQIEDPDGNPIELFEPAR